MRVMLAAWFLLLVMLSPAAFADTAEQEAERATQLNQQAAQLYQQGKYPEALALMQQALMIHEKVFGAGRIETVALLSNLAQLYVTLGQYDKALPLYQRALAIREKMLGQEHSDTAASLNSLASVYQTLNQYDQALPLYQRALAINEKILGPEHADTAASLGGLGSLYEAIGQYDKALPLYERALAICEKSFGAEDANVPVCQTRLAGLYERLGWYDKAMPLLQRALTINEKTLGKDHVNTASSMIWLAQLYTDLGQYEQALTLSRNAVTIFEKNFGPEHSFIAGSLRMVAFLYQELDQYDKALPLYQRALAINEKAFGAEHADTAAALSNLAGIYLLLEKYQQALPLYQRALAITEKVSGKAHVNTAMLLFNFSKYYSMQHLYPQALSMNVQALGILEEKLGPEHDLAAHFVDSIAFLHAKQHQSQDALKYFLQGRDISSRVIARSFPVLSEQEKLALVKKQEWQYYGLLSLVHSQLGNDAQAVSHALDTVLSRKGIVLDAQARQQNAIAQSLNPETRKLWDELSGQRALLTKLMQAGMGKLKPEDYQAKLKITQDAITQLESQLAGKSALVAQDLKQRNVTYKEVAQVLDKDAILVEFAKIHDFDWDHGKWADTWRYLAFVLHGDGKIQMVDLGEAATLEKGVQSALQSIGRVGSNAARQQDATRNLHQFLWQPLADAVGNIPKVVFSPDGLLNLVPFAAMQDKAGHYLVESRQISYVTSGRDLTRGDLGIKYESGLYLAANPQFDLAAPQHASEQPEPNRGAVRSAGFGLQFSPLPGTAKEAEQIPTYLKGKQTVLTGKDATEDSVLEIKRPRVMHLSTHGFFLADQAVIAQGARGAVRIKNNVQPDLDNAGAALPPGYENPLVRSGLAFAGANHAAEAKDGRDGLLTALEVSGMDLHGTDLVTLSACETGRGEVKSGEGVFGLRRAFELAGASHLMMSLWPVSDAATARQMKSFYQLYGQKPDPAYALRQVQLETIADLRDRKGEADPALWAPFIVQGW